MSTPTICSAESKEELSHLFILTMDNRGVILSTPTNCSAESNGKLPHIFIPSKTATLVPEFTVEVLPLCSTAALVPKFAMEDLRLGRTHR